MPHFAQLDNTCTVINVITGSNDETELQLTLRTGNTYRQTSYNTHGGVHYQDDGVTPSDDQSKAFRKNFAGVGYRYDVERDAFIPPKSLYQSCVLNETTGKCEAPVSHPSDGKLYSWDEENKQWVETPA